MIVTVVIGMTVVVLMTATGAHGEARSAAASGIAETTVDALDVEEAVAAALAEEVAERPAGKHLGAVSREVAVKKKAPVMTEEAVAALAETIADLKRKTEKTADRNGTTENAAGQGARTAVVREISCEARSW
mmetsp:Transcript_159538/g.294213  ORF Transcript_159538/g.294213 Transcript_159538/m.294213 type:complete len:132 (-) Transcript_159538:26-421(-)